MPPAAPHQQLLGHAHLVEAVREMPARRRAGRCTCRGRRSCRRFRAASGRVPPARGRRARRWCAGPRRRSRRSSPRWSGAACSLRWLMVQRPAPASCGHPVSPASAVRAIHAASTRMKWFFSRCFEEGHALAHLACRQMITRGCGCARLRALSKARRPPAGRCRRRAARASRTPPTCPASGSKPSTSVDGPSACWLLTSTMRDQVVELESGRPTSRPPTSSPRRARRRTCSCRRSGRIALLAAARAPCRQRSASPMPERAAGDLHARRVGGHAGHRQAAVVAAVGLQLGLGDRCRPRSAPRRARWRSGRCESRKRSRPSHSGSSGR